MRVLSGIQPTGQFHLGNYLGALKRWLQLEEDVKNECFYPIVDLHALTVIHNGKTLRENIKESQIAMLAVGFNPEKCVLFVQSAVPEHTELAWILATLTSVGDLERMTQYKDKSKLVGKLGVNAGLLTYPALMAADILLYNPDYVPVGEDQKQHLELTRNIADKFNTAYGETFKLPAAMIEKESARVMSLQDPSKKMSKSLGPEHYVGLFEEENLIREKIKRAVTDSGKEIKYDPKNKPAISNLLAIYSGVTARPVKEIEKEFQGVGYADFKYSLADMIINHLRPIQIKYSELKNNPSAVEEIFIKGARMASVEARKVMKIVREKIGIR